MTAEVINAKQGLTRIPRRTHQGNRQGKVQNQ